MRLSRRTLSFLGGWTPAACGQSASNLLFNGDLLADYFQIYVRDQGYPELPSHYRDEDIASRLMTGPYAAIVNTARNMTVPVKVEWYDVRPQPEIDRSQHVVEVRFNCPSGIMVLAGIIGYDPTAQQFSVKAGPIGIRVNMSGLDTISEYSLDGDDRYLIQLWPDLKPPGRRVLEAWAMR